MLLSFVIQLLPFKPECVRESLCGLAMLNARKSDLIILCAWGYLYACNVLHEEVQRITLVAVHDHDFGACRRLTPSRRRPTRPLLRRCRPRPRARRRRPAPSRRCATPPPAARRPPPAAACASSSATASPGPAAPSRCACLPTTCPFSK